MCVRYIKRHLDLPQEVLQIYSQSVCQNGRACTRASGLLELLPFGTLIHEELFEPVGYSMNGLVANTDQYATVHVTPEPNFAYVSFETNQRRKCLYKQTLQVLDCFKYVLINCRYSAFKASKVHYDHVYQ